MFFFFFVSNVNWICGASENRQNRVSHGESVRVGSSGPEWLSRLAIGHSSSPELISFLTLEKENLNDINHDMLFYFKVLNRYFP